MREIIIGIIDKLNIQVLLLGAWIISIVGVFLPKNFIEYIGLIQVKTRYQWIISLVFLAIGAYYLALLIRWGNSKVSAKWKNKKFKKYFFKVLRELTDDEKCILINFYRRDEKNLDWKRTWMFGVLRLMFYHQK